MHRNIAFIVTFFVVFTILTGCENDLSSVRAIELRQQGEVEFTKEAEIIYSDSARVKAKLKAPQLFNHKTKDPYYEMPKGIEVIFFDAFQKQTSKVTSEYAIRKENQRTIELRKNVIAVNNKGETFRSEELIWDENQKRFYSNKVVNISTNKATISGTSFWATEDFSYYEIVHGAGPIQFNENLGGQ
jgi:LPS export ABC transporter protein LptC